MSSCELKLRNTKMATFTVILFVLQIFAGVSLAVTCPAHILSRRRTHTAVFRDTCYLFVNNERYWNSAKSDCLSLGGEMVSVKDKETMDFLRSKLNSRELSWDRNGVWLGAKYDSRDWRWTDGTKLEYTDWAPGEPGKYLGVCPPCVQMRLDDNWQWHNRLCNSLNFHYNYICQFPTTPSTASDASTTRTATTTTTAAAATSTSARTTTSIPTSTTMSKYDSVLRDSKDLKSDLYSQLGKNVYRLLMEGGGSNPSLSLLLKEAMANNHKDGTSEVKIDGKEESKTKETVDKGRVASSASNQAEDNGFTLILIIVISLAVGFLICLLVIFLIIRRHYRRMREKNEERAVHYHNHNGFNGNGPAVRRDPEDQPPSIPSTRPPPLNDVYLMPAEVTDQAYSQVNKPRNTIQTTNVQNSNACTCSPEEPLSSPSASAGHTGACGGSDAEFDQKLPLMSGVACESSVRNGPAENCGCHGSLSQDDYVDMRNMSSMSDSGKPSPDEDKHTYCNTNPEPRENTATENVYETLP